MLLKLSKSKEAYLPVGDRLSLNKSLELRVLSKYLELRPGERLLDAQASRRPRLRRGWNRCVRA